MDLLGTSVGGMSFGLWILLIFGGFALYYFMMEWWATRNLIRKSENKILCLMHTPGGQAYLKWCWEDKGELTPADTKGYDKKANMLADKAVGKIVAENQEFGWYFVLPDHVFTIPYPFEKPKTAIRIASYLENYPAPLVTANMREWTPEKYAAVTSEMAAYSKDTTDLRAIISESAGIEEKLMELLEMPKKLQQIFYVAVAAFFAGLVSALLIFQVSGQVGKVVTNFGITMLPHLTPLYDAVSVVLRS